MKHLTSMDTLLYQNFQTVYQALVSCTVHDQICILYVCRTGWNQGLAFPTACLFCDRLRFMNKWQKTCTSGLRAHRRIFRVLLRKWNVTSGNWRHHIMSWQENPLTSKSHRTNCCFDRRFFLALPRARSQINCACVNELTSGLGKKLNFRRF